MSTRNVVNSNNPVHINQNTNKRNFDQFAAQHNTWHNPNVTSIAQAHFPTSPTPTSPNLPHITDVLRTPLSLFNFIDRSPGSPASPATSALDDIASRALYKMPNAGAIEAIRTTTKTDMLACFSQKEYQKAIDTFNLVKHLFPNQADFLVLLGDCYKELGDLDNATKCYLSALTHENSLQSKATVSFKAAELFGELNKLKLAQEHINNALQYLPQDCDVKIKSKMMEFQNTIITKIKSQEAQQKKLPHPAMESVVRATNSSYALRCLESGIKLLNSKQFAQAQSQFQLGLNLSYISADIRSLLSFNIGNAHSELGRSYDSISAYEEALLSATNENVRAEIVFRLGAVLIKEKQFEAAQFRFEDATKTLKKISGNNRGLIYLGLATIYEEMNKSPEAREALYKGLAERENPITDEMIKAKLYLNLAENYLRSGSTADISECIRLLGLGLSCQNINPELLVNMHTMKGVALEKSATPNFLSMAINEYTIALNLTLYEATKGILCLKIANAQQKNGKIKEAIYTCMRGIRLINIQNEIRSNLMILKGKLAIKEAFAEIQQASILPGVSNETLEDAKNTITHINNCIFKITSNASPDVNNNN